ncbi:helix-turn-helix domain-containing protein [Leucobacter celer]|uniref:helix-turn-helix domain-containing protein n=1 Tax=Leucobacter celer TaxID=668625 RepID=UPI0009495602
MSHRNAKLTPAGRHILVQRVLSGRPVAHVAKEMGISRQCAHRWIGRYRRDGLSGLRDRSSRPRHSPGRITAQLTEHVLRIRVDERVGRDEIARRTGISPTTVSRIIVSAGLPPLHQLDPVTGVRIRAARRTTHRYERDAPGRPHPYRCEEARTDSGRRWLARGRPGRDRSQSWACEVKEVGDGLKRSGFDGDSRYLIPTSCSRSVCPA